MHQADLRAAGGLVYREKGHYGTSCKTNKMFMDASERMSQLTFKCGNDRRSAHAGEKRLTALHSRCTCGQTLWEDLELSRRHRDYFEYRKNQTGGNPPAGVLRREGSIAGLLKVREGSKDWPSKNVLRREGSKEPCTQA